MTLIAQSSLMDAIDHVNSAFFWGRPLSRHESVEIAREIADRQGLEGAYAGTFALTDDERSVGIRLFTGEPAQCAAARHIAGEEACRALLLLEPSEREPQLALTRASIRLMERLGGWERAPANRMAGNPGTYCCGRCSVAMWRHVLAGGLDRREVRLTAGIRKLKEHRDGEGRWNVFPFWYTLSALVEIDDPREIHGALAELRYAAPTLERFERRHGAADGESEFLSRRRETARRLLAVI